MDKKNFKKYFTQTKKLLFSGIGIIAAGIILYFLNDYLLHEWQIYQASWLVMVAGVVVIICHFAVRIRDGAVDEYASGFGKVLEEELETFVNESEKHKKYTRVFDYTSCAYELWDKDIEYLVFGGDNTPRCEQYGGGSFTYTADTFYLVTGNIDLISGEVKTSRFSAPLSEIKTVKITDKSYSREMGKKSRYIESFVIETVTDNASAFFTVHADAMTDEAVSKINRMAESKRN